MAGLKVYILGAGCSAGCGYPLAKDFVSELEKFAQGLPDKPECQRIRRRCESTIRLLRERGLATLDDLAANLGVKAPQSHRSHQKAPSPRFQIDDARLATEVLFRSLEAQAENKLKSYRWFLTEMLGPPHQWRRGLGSSDYRVLTFNYDRLFELAFLRGSGWGTGIGPLYLQDGLSAGIDYSGQASPSFARDRLALLKLHGSVGIWSQLEGGSPRFRVASAPSEDQPLVLSDAEFVQPMNDPDPYERSKPLIVFPHEKTTVPQELAPSSFYQTYLAAVTQDAEWIVSQASSLHFIGYSVAAMDQQFIKELLGCAQPGTKLIIQSIPDSIDGIRRRIEDREWKLPSTPVYRPEAF